MMADFRESSKARWSSNTSIEHINAGSFQRIADAIELSCKDRERLEREYAYMRESRDLERKRADRLARSNSALRGVIKRMKRAAAQRNA